MNEIKSEIGRYYTFGVIGVAICVISCIFELIGLFTESEVLTTMGEWLSVFGALIWGISLVKAGQIFKKIGLLKTGVPLAGIGLLIWAFTLLIVNIVTDSESSMGSLIFWVIVSLIGPAIFYYALRDPSGDNNEKFMTTASQGMGVYIVGNLLMIWALGKLLSAMHHDSAVGNFIAGNFYLVFTVLFFAQIAGLCMCFGSMLTYKDFVDELEFVDEESTITPPTPPAI